MYVCMYVCMYVWKRIAFIYFSQGVQIPRKSIQNLAFELFFSRIGRRTTSRSLDRIQSCMYVCLRLRRLSTLCMSQAAERVCMF